MIDGRQVACQRFISILCPINAVTTPIVGSQETLPYIGQLTGIMLEEDESLYLESEDLQSAFNLFAVRSNGWDSLVTVRRLMDLQWGCPREHKLDQPYL